MTRRRQRRAVILLQKSLGLDDERQEKAVLGFAAERGHTVTSVTWSPSAALALIRDRLVDVVLVCFSTRGTDELGDVIHDLGGELEAVRQSARVVLADERTARIVRAAIERGATVEATALVLGMTVGQVRAALGEAGHGEAEVRHAVTDLPDRERRVARAPRPQDRRPEPAVERVRRLDRPAERRPRTLRSA